MTASSDEVKPDTAKLAAAEAARELGIEAPLLLLRSGDNDVFQAGDVVLRVASNEADVLSQLALASWLADRGLPVLRPISDVVALHDKQVTVWEYVRGEQPIDYRQWGEAISLLHQMSVEGVAELVALPWCGGADWLQLAENLETAANAGVVSDEDIEVLGAATVDAADWQHAARCGELVVCHGDVHPQNVLMRGDELIIIDWDSICIGPTAWDHAALLTWADRWGGAPGEYTAFADGYGGDMRESPLAQILARVRLLAPTINMIIRGATSSRHAEEARLRMLYWQGVPSAPAWTGL